MADLSAADVLKTLVFWPYFAGEIPRDFHRVSAMVWPTCLDLLILLGHQELKHIQIHYMDPRHD